MAGLFRRCCARTAPQTRLALEPLEGRLVPTTNLILDFGGGVVPASSSYQTAPGSTGVNFTPFAALPATTGGSTADRNQQILEVVAGVREVFAPYDVNVVWDDRGVSSPLFRAGSGDTVMMVVNDSPTTVGESSGTAGVAPLDVNQGTAQQTADVGLVFANIVATVDAGQPATEIRELVETVSHEAGHTFGLQHTLNPDATRTQVMDPGTDPTAEDLGLAPRFSTQVSPLEGGGSNSEAGRLTQTVGLSPATDLDTQVGLPLVRNTPVVQVSGSIATNASGAIDFAGDRDAFQFVAPASGPFTVTETAAVGATLHPTVTVWDGSGNFMAVGSSGGNASSVTFTAVSGQTYFAIAGSAADQQAGPTPVSETGAYTMAFATGSGTGGGTGTGTGPGSGSGTGSGSGSGSGSAPNSQAQLNALINQLVIANLQAVFAQPIPPGSPILTAAITAIADANGDGYADVSAVVVLRSGRNHFTLLRLTFDGLSPSGGLIGQPMITQL